MREFNQEKPLPLKEGLIKIGNTDFDKKKVGWKIHLSVKESNQIEVFNFLVKFCPYTCKYKAGGELGKEFTIYIGSWDETEKFASLLEKNLKEKLSNICGDCLRTDLPITEHIAARFSFNEPRKSDYEQYGYFGIPYLRSERTETLKLLPFPSTIEEASKEKFLIIKELLKKSYLELNKTFGKYFTGKDNRVGKKFIGWINENKKRLGVN
jgi:hypothetical protein